jgi:hypothetical protein
MSLEDIMYVKDGTQKVQTTIRVPKKLYEQAKNFIQSGTVDVDSINDFVVEALRLRIKGLRRRLIDAEFAKMANDAGYQKEAQLITEEFEESDWETIRDF